MDTLETNVAKIHIGNSKQTNTYVATLAERTSHEDCELFAVVALPLLNPAAEADCERIASGILGALRRCYKRSSNDSTFEVALGEINDEIGKLASLGQSNWSGKVSAVLGVRQGMKFYAAATGKASALLMRDGEFNEITEATNAKHPLKTFDTFSAGKIKVGDVLIITTAELFNHVSIDRIRNILTQNTLELAAQELVRVIEDTAGPEVAFGTLLLQETEPLVASEDGMQSQTYIAATKPTNIANQIKDKTKQVLSKETAQNIWQVVKTASKKRPSLDIKKLSGAVSRSAEGFSALKNQAQNYKNINWAAPWTTFKNFSRPKQFFTASVIVLLIAVVVNLFVAQGRKSTSVAQSTFNSSAGSIQKLLSDADSKLVFKDEAGAAMALQEAKQKIEGLNAASETQNSTKDELEKQAANIAGRLYKLETAEVITLATLSNAKTLLSLPNILATATGKVVVSYNTNTNTTEDGALRTPTDIVAAATLDNTQALVFDGQGLVVWNFSKGTSTAPFFLNVPKASNFVGMARYPTNNRVYIVDTALSQVTSYLVSGSNVSKPITSVKNSGLQDAQSIAVDGSIYVLTKTGVLKFNAGKTANFTLPTLAEPFSGNGKLFTDSKTKQVYILDANGRVIITDKTGKLIKVLQNDQLKDASDFVVDEANKVIYVLRSGSLLKLSYSL